MPARVAHRDGAQLPAHEVGGRKHLAPHGIDAGRKPRGLGNLRRVLGDGFDQRGSTGTEAGNRAFDAAGQRLDLVRELLAITLGCRVRQRAFGGDDLLVEVGELGAQRSLAFLVGPHLGLGLFKPGIAGAASRQFFGGRALFR